MIQRAINKLRRKFRRDAFKDANMLKVKNPSQETKPILLPARPQRDRAQDWCAVTVMLMVKIVMSKYQKGIALYRRILITSKVAADVASKICFGHTYGLAYRSLEAKESAQRAMGARYSDKSFVEIRIASVPI